MAIVLKPHGGLNGTGPLCRKTIERVGHDNFTLMYDPGNIFYYSGGEVDPVEDAATVDGLVTGLSVKDYRHPKNVAITPGAGQIDFPALMARLARGGFTRGPLVVETLAPGDPAQTLEEARKARRFVEKLVADGAHAMMTAVVEFRSIGRGFASAAMGVMMVHGGPGRVARRA